MRFFRRNNTEKQYVSLVFIAALNISGVCAAACVLAFLYRPLNSGIPVAVSRAVTSQYAAGDFAVIAAGADGSLSIKGRPASGGDIRIFLDQLRDRNDTVVIQADKRAGVDAVTRLLDDCRAAGVRRILLSTEK